MKDETSINNFFLSDGQTALPKLTHGSLFSGIGGFELGAEWAGIPTYWNCDINEWNRKLLKHRFPNTEQYDDIRTLTNPRKVNIISGGFPCQDISGQTQKPKELKDIALDCGVKCTGLWGKLDLNTSSLKIAQTSLFEDLNESYATFPKSGMMRNGNVYQLQPLDSNIEGNESMLLPTPTHTVSFQIGWETPLLMWRGIKTRKSGVKFGVNLGWTLKKWYLDKNNGEVKDKTLLPNPYFVELVMGYPKGWTDLQV